MRSQLLFGIIAFLVIFIGAVLLFKPLKETQNQSRDRLAVITTLYPLYDFTRQVGKDKVSVTLLLPPGVESHSFEPKPADILRINQADIFIYTGKFMEPWTEKIISGTYNKRLTVVDASQGITLTGAIDPHIWLDFDNAKIMAETITKTLAAKDPANKTFYEEGFKSFSGQLTALDAEYKSTLAGCKKKDIIYGGHYAFGYLAKRYGLTYMAAEGVSADSEPTTQDLIRLIDQVKKKSVKYIFYEELTSPKIAQTLAKETNTQLLLLNAAHNLSKEQFTQGVSFINIMRSNLQNLKIGLECS